MARESSIFHLTLLFIFIISVGSAVMVKDSTVPTNNSLTGIGKTCAAIPNDCFAGRCNGGVCGPCPHNPLRCCLLAAGNCTSSKGVPYGLCAPTCNCDECKT